jgi:two-component system chemotaxis response regulator CheY
VRALIVDDSRAMRLILTRILADLGFETEEAAHGREALERVERGGSFDVIMVDWNMPEMNGYDFVVALRAKPAHRRVPVVMVTTETETAKVARALEAGATEYVMKPFTREVIREKLDLLQIAPA